MKWCEFKVLLNRDSVSYIKTFFLNHRISTYSEYAARGARKVEVRAFIPASKHKALLAELRGALDLFPQFFPSEAVPVLSVDFKEEKEYAEAWKKHFHPLEVGRFLILPTWEKEAPESGKTVIRIDPGMAFGTGQHFTTRYCISRMEKCFAAGGGFFDAGCGSGILSIAAAKLGAKSISGIDMDREAVKVSKRNFESNCPGISAEFSRMKLERMKGEELFDSIAANLTDPVLVKNAGALQKLLKRKGVLIVSGIRYAKVKAVEDSFSGLECSDKDNDEKKEWAGLTFLKT
jgi:ribosomal protein L11 methyltransferase